jgi:lipopolysaccharide transport system permease protein
MYSIDIVPERFMAIYFLNPMTPIILAYRDILYYGKVPRLTTLLHAVLMGMILLVIGFLVFGKLKRRFAEEL